MARGDDLFARLEVSFMRSFRFLKLPLGARMLFLSLWCYSLECKRQTIDRPDDNYLRNLAGLRGKPIPEYLQLLDEDGLIILNLETIEVVGIREKHKRFQWSDDPNGERKGPVKKHSVPEETRRDEKRKDKVKRKPKTGPNTQTLIAHFCDKHKEHFNKPYKISGQDAGLMKSLFDTYDYDTVEDIIDGFFTYQDDWLNKTGRTIITMNTKFNEMIQKQDAPAFKGDVDPDEWRGK